MKNYDGKYGIPTKGLKRKRPSYKRSKYKTSQDVTTQPHNVLSTKHKNDPRIKMPQVQNVPTTTLYHA
jgi:hypothetical protein